MSGSFIGRADDLRELNHLLEVSPNTGVMAMVYGRRRVGKTTLLLEWIRRSGRRGLYWMAKNATPEVLRADLARKIWQWAYGGESVDHESEATSDISESMSAEVDPPTFRDWGQLFEAFARLMDKSRQPLIVVFDEFAVAVDADKSLPSYLQEAWDHHLKDKPITLVLTGSHIGMMIDLGEYKRPLYGRITARLPITALPYAAVQDFLPKASSVERLAAYSILGGIPAYLERFKDTRSVVDSVREHLFRKVGFFRSEPDQILGELTRDSGRYLSVIRAIADGKHTSGEIAGALELQTGDVTPYLRRLREMHLVERRFPVSIPDTEREGSLRGRYFLRDPYLQFYYRFVERHADRIEQGLMDVAWRRISEQLRAYIGGGSFEQICRDWVIGQARRGLGEGALPFEPELVGSEWNSDAQADVAAINFREKQILLGECKWTADRIRRTIVTDLVYDKTPKLRPSPEWAVHYAFFSRAGFTPDALAEIKQCQGLAISFAEVDRDLRRAFEENNVTREI
jgi:hypothetical protein